MLYIWISEQYALQQSFPCDVVAVMHLDTGRKDVQAR